MTPIAVSTPAALLAALKTATAGVVILLAPGKWEPVLIVGFQTSGEVTLRSQDAAHPAILSSLTINQSEGLTLRNLALGTELYNAPTSMRAPIPFRIAKSKRITLEDVSIHGTLDGDPRDDVNGLFVSDSTQVRIVNCEFQQLYNALIELRNDDVLIYSNKFHDIRNDGIENGGTSNITISKNRFYDFYPVNVGGPGDHPDAIQFWTVQTKEAAHDINITDNTFERGHGLWIQGIFVTDQMSLPYQRLKITGNSIRGGLYNGIMVQGCTGMTLTGNTVLPYSDRISWIRIEKCSDSTLSHNRAGDYIYKNNGHLSESDNGKIFPIPSPYGSPPSDKP